jgi:hypothetical protein
MTSVESRIDLGGWSACDALHPFGSGRACFAL